MKVNQQTAEPGCFIDGHHGQYGLDMMADVCEQFGVQVTNDDDPRYWRRVAEGDEEAWTQRGETQDRVKPEDAWERQVESVDFLERELNDVTEGGHWEWQDGEFFLFQTEVERWLYVTATDYDAAWLQVVEANVNEHAGYTDQYQACELTDDGDPDDHVYQFKITVECDLFAGTREEMSNDD